MSLAVRLSDMLGRTWRARQWQESGMPCGKGAYIDCNREPEDRNEALFGGFVSQKLLSEQCAGPAADQGQEMESLL